MAITMPASLASADARCASPLPEPAPMAAALRQRLPAWPHVAWCASTGSTQTDLQQYVQASATEAAHALPALVGAHEQTLGKGRAGRTYRNRAGQTLMQSCAYPVRLPVAALPTLAVWLAVASAEFLREHLASPQALTLKWPNDINWWGAKLAGMLLEVARQGSAPVVVVGLGLNLGDGKGLSAALQRDITDWQQTGSPTSAVELAAGLASAWQAAIAVAESHWQTGVGLPFLPQRFSACDALHNANVVLRDHDTWLADGLASGVLPDGRLRLRTAEGERLVSVGELSIRPAS